MPIRALLSSVRSVSTFKRAFLCLLVFSGFLTFHSLYKSSSIRKQQQNRQTNYDADKMLEPLILYWTTWFGQNDPSYDDYAVWYNSCKCKCQISNNRALINDAGAIMIFGYDFTRQLGHWFHWLFGSSGIEQLYQLIEARRTPAGRQIRQLPLIVYYTQEPPTMANAGGSKALAAMNENFFTKTMTYHLNADYVFTYETTFDIPKPLPSDINMTVNKTGFVVSVVSHCRTQSKRETIIAQLAALVPLTTYGSCGVHSLKCGTNGEQAVDCAGNIVRQYKFMLAFENSLCTDYVTEKFFKAFLYDTVPIVYGHARYELYAPNHSYINVRDFPTVAALADYLHYLNRNASAYNEYFWWRKVGNRSGNFVSWPASALKRRKTSNQIMCDLCCDLHRRQESGLAQYDDRKINLTDYWNSCVDPQSYDITKFT